MTRLNMNDEAMFLFSVDVFMVGHTLVASFSWTHKGLYVYVLLRADKVLLCSKY